MTVAFMVLSHANNYLVENNGSLRNIILNITWALGINKNVKYIYTNLMPKINY